MDGIIAHNIMDKMWHVNWKPSDLSKAAGLTKGQISEILNGKNTKPSVWTMSKIADALKCTVDDLIRSP